MDGKHEQRAYENGERVRAEKYRNPRCLSHLHDDCELLYVESGKADVFCRGRRYTLEARDAIYIHGGEIHHMQAREETVMLAFAFKKELVESVCGDEKPITPLISASSAIPPAYAFIKRELKTKSKYHAAAADARAELMLVELFRNLPMKRCGQPDSGMNALAGLLDDAEERYADYTFEKAAKFTGFSDAYFSRLFHKRFGMTFSQYLNDVRIKHAVGIMRSDKKISMAELAVKTGFTTVRNFNRMFRSVTGFSPRDLPDDFGFENKDIDDVT